MLARRPNAGSATTAAPVEALEEADMRVAVGAAFEEAEFLVPDDLIDSLIVEGIGELDAEPEEVAIDLVAGTSLADADVEFERDVEAVVATDTEYPS
ncbi:hypothetical protein KCU93_g2422, partial [Aureobasidium melanogenum]|jgi:hypothetical protein